MTRARDLANIGPGVPTGFRNLLINGDMRVKQRSAFTTTTNAYQFTTDRWFVFSGVSTVGAPSYVTASTLTNFPNALRAQRQASNAGTAAIVLGQTIESADVNQIRGNAITISFWARAGANYSATSNALGVYFVQGTGVDQGTNGAINQTWTGVTIPLIGTATLTTSWQKFTCTYTVLSTTNVASLWFYQTPTGTAGANDWFDVTGVQLELGSVATPFEQRSIGTELALCQRHYHVSGTQYGPATGFGLGNSYHGPVYYPTTMRAAPAVTVFNGSGTANSVSWYPGNTPGTPGLESINTGSFVINQSSSSYNGALYTFTASAEL